MPLYGSSGLMNGNPVGQLGGLINNANNFSYPMTSGLLSALNQPQSATSNVPDYSQIALQMAGNPHAGPYAPAPVPSGSFIQPSPTAGQTSGTSTGANILGTILGLLGSQGGSSAISNLLGGSGSSAGGLLSNLLGGGSAVDNAAGTSGEAALFNSALGGSGATGAGAAAAADNAAGTGGEAALFNSALGGGGAGIAAAAPSVGVDLAADPAIAADAQAALADASAGLGSDAGAGAADAAAGAGSSAAGLAGGLLSGAALGPGLVYGIGSLFDFLDPNVQMTPQQMAALTPQQTPAAIAAQKLNPLISSNSPGMAAFFGGASPQQLAGLGYTRYG